MMIIIPLSHLEILTSLVWTWDTFENNFKIDHKFARYLKELWVGFGSTFFPSNISIKLKFLLYICSNRRFHKSNIARIVKPCWSYETSYVALEKNT